VRCTATVTHAVSKGPSVHLVDRAILLGPPDERWICDVAHWHDNEAEAVACNEATVLTNRLHASHGHVIVNIQT